MIEPIREVQIHDEGFAAIRLSICSTIQRLGKTSKPATSDRFTISNFRVPVRETTRAILSPR
jgi:hypothetical protein